MVGVKAQRGRGLRLGIVSFLSFAAASLSPAVAFVAPSSAPSLLALESANYAPIISSWGCLKGHRCKFSRSTSQVQMAQGDGRYGSGSSSSEPLWKKYLREGQSPTSQPSQNQNQNQNSPVNQNRWRPRPSTSGPVPPVKTTPTPATASSWLPKSRTPSNPPPVEPPKSRPVDIPRSRVTPPFSVETRSVDTSAWLPKARPAQPNTAIPPPRSRQLGQEQLPREAGRSMTQSRRLGDYVGGGYVRGQRESAGNQAGEQEELLPGRTLGGGAAELLPGRTLGGGAEPLPGRTLGGGAELLPGRTQSVGSVGAGAAGARLGGEGQRSPTLDGAKRAPSYNAVPKKPPIAANNQVLLLEAQAARQLKNAQRLRRVAEEKEEEARRAGEEAEAAQRMALQLHEQARLLRSSTTHQNPAQPPPPSRASPTPQTAPPSSLYNPPPPPSPSPSPSPAPPLYNPPPPPQDAAFAQGTVAAEGQREGEEGGRGGEQEREERGTPGIERGRKVNTAGKPIFMSQYLPPDVARSRSRAVSEDEDEEERSREEEEREEEREQQFKGGSDTKWFGVKDGGMKVENTGQNPQNVQTSETSPPNFQNPPQNTHEMPSMASGGLAATVDSHAPDARDHLHEHHHHIQSTPPPPTPVTFDQLHSASSSSYTTDEGGMFTGDLVPSSAPDDYLKALSGERNTGVQRREGPDRGGVPDPLAPNPVAFAGAGNGVDSAAAAQAVAPVGSDASGVAPVEGSQSASVEGPEGRIASTLLPRLAVLEFEGAIFEEPPEHYAGPPFRWIQGAVRDCMGEEVKVQPGVPELLRRCGWTEPASSQVAHLAVLTRTSRPHWAQLILEAYLVEPGVPLWQHVRFFSVVPGLEPSQPASETLRAVLASSTVQSLSKTSQVDYEDMIFFGREMRVCRELGSMGVTSIRTPYGMSREVWDEGLELHATLLAEQREGRG